MKEFDELVAVANHLNDPIKGCPWDLKQTFATLQKYVLEEACELVDAIDDDKDKDIIEELGDYLYVVLFYCKVAERDKRFTLKTVIETVKEKLIRRHPHVFANKACKDIKEVELLWNQVKAEEKKERTSALDAIPRALLSLARAQKVLSKLIDDEYEHIKAALPKKVSEEEMGKKLIDLVLQAEADGIDAEKALRSALKSYELAFRDWEKQKNKATT